MVPGFWYRSLRYGLRAARVARLPLRPPEAPVIGPALGRLRARLRRTRLGPNTFAMVNALGRRPSGSDRAGCGSDIAREVTP